MILGSALRRRVLGLVALVCVFSAAPPVAKAQIGSDRYASIVIDEQTGQILSQANADEYRFPASLTKMMTIYMVFEAVRDGRLSFGDLVPVSAWAASMPPTKLGLVPGTTLTVEQAILGLVTKSANDAAAALGELLAGDEDRFAQLMTVRAHALGMGHTTFRNASGLPDWGQVTTARDLAVLARHLIQDFPQHYHYFSTPSFIFHGRLVPNHQTMLRSYAGADGLKTGYTEASGYNVVTSAVHGEARLIGVVLGAGNGWERDQHMTALLDQGFMQLGIGPVQVSHRGSPFIGAARAAPVLMPIPSPYYAEPPFRAARGRRLVAVRPLPRPWIAPRYMETPVHARGPMAREAARPIPHARLELPRASRQLPSWRYPG